MTLQARYSTPCHACGAMIRPGDLMRHDGDGWTHVVCEGEPSVDLAPTETVCTTCFLVKPCPCEDEQ